jgi:zinc protease
MAERSDPLRIAYGAPVDGLTVVRQAAPAGAASFSATYVAPAGWGHDPDGSEGAARLVNQLITSGAGRHDRVALARLLDRAGATLTRQCAPESAEVTIWGPAEAGSQLLSILADVVRRPRFDPEDVARARRQLRERQLREQSEPAHRAERELLRAIFPPGHPYRGLGLGDSRSLGRLGRRRLTEFHRDHYGPHQGLLVVTGPLSLSAVEAAARRLFAHASERPVAPLPMPAARGRPHGAVKVDLPGRSQVEMRVGAPSIARSDPAFPAAFLANELLGDRPLLNRLFQRVREGGGLTYHASSSLEAMRFGGYWEVQAGSGADRWRKVVPMLHQEVARLREETVSAIELALIRESAIGELPLSLETTAEAHELAVEAAYFGLASDHWLRWPSVLRSVRPAELRAAAATAFPSDREATVIAGPLTPG